MTSSEEFAVHTIAHELFTLFYHAEIPHTLVQRGHELIGDLLKLSAVPLGDMPGLPGSRLRCPCPSHHYSCECNGEGGDR